jgi:microcystin-dependent protein
MSKGKILKNKALNESVYNKEAVERVLMKAVAELEGIMNTKLDLKPDEAPEDGKGYWRQNGKWSEIHLPAAVSTSYVGEIFWYPKTTPPPNALYCDGSAVGREEYPELYAVIGDSFGAGNGSTTFNLPDMRGEFVRGYDPGNARDPSGSTRAFGKHQNGTMLPYMMVWREANNTVGIYVVAPTTASQGSSPSETDGFTNMPTYTRGKFNGSNDVYTAQQYQSRMRPTNISLLPCIRYSNSFDKDLVAKSWVNVPLIRAANNSGGTFELKYNALLGLYEIYLRAVIVKANTAANAIMARLQNPDEWPVIHHAGFRSCMPFDSGGIGVRVDADNNIAFDGVASSSDRTLNINALATAT